MAVIKVFPPPVSHSYMFLSFPSASVFKAQISFLPSNPQPQKDPTHPEYLEFGKVAQLLGSSEDRSRLETKESNSENSSFI